MRKDTATGIEEVRKVLVHVAELMTTSHHNGPKACYDMMESYAELVATAGEALDKINECETLEG